MNPKIKDLLAQITALEDELRSSLQEQESQLLYHFKGRRVEFEDSLRETHRRLKRGILHWMLVDRPQNLLTGPVIYSLGIPLLLLDLSVSLYQALCFPVYRVGKVRRAAYFSYDRRHLAYLNFFERLHCGYCSYANGVLAYATEIAARTEQYFCPIKHARRVLGEHSRHRRFLDYGESADYHGRLEAYRRALQEEGGGDGDRDAAGR